MIKSTLFAAAAASASALFFAPSASAFDVKFKFDADSLNTKKGAVRIAERLEKEITNACTTNGRRSLSTIASERTCTVELMEQMVSKINDQRLNNVLNGAVIVAQNEV